MTARLWEKKMEYALIVVSALLVNQIIYDRFVQRKSALLINYPVIGRMRYLFELLREPLRQYFGDEQFYESRDKVDWVYNAAKNKPNFISFSVSQQLDDTHFIIKHSNVVLNEDEVSDDFSVSFGPKREQPFTSQSVISRSGMSDGALSPEATRAFALGARKGHFPINTGEGGLTSNYFFDFRPECVEDQRCFEVHTPTDYEKKVFRYATVLFNGSVALRLLRRVSLKGKIPDTWIFDRKNLLFFRPDWEAPLDCFPKEVPVEMGDVILQVGSGLYGVRDREGHFDPERYQKTMAFCKMTEIKIAQGAKQTGGKIVASKVTEDIAYFRGVEPHQNLMSPNRFPFAENLDELFDFCGMLQGLSKKPVGIKIVVSDYKDVDAMVKTFQKRRKDERSVPDFVTIDAGDGGTATAPLELMESVGLNLINSLYIVDAAFRRHGERGHIKLIVSGKILTPDDVVKALALGADMVAIARAFMMSGGCIRARHCSGIQGTCPVGMATQDKSRRSSFLVYKKADHIANYHNNLIKGIKTMLAVMGVGQVGDLDKTKLTFKNKNGEIYFDVDAYFAARMHV